MSRQFKAEQGYLSFALGAKYLDCAYVQALSIKCTQKYNNYAVVVDKKTNELIEEDQRKVFDYVHVLDYEPSDWDMSQDWRALSITPWRETIMLNADMIFTTSVDHWWDTLRLREVCFATHIEDFKNQKITSREHRKLFDKNNLPNIYTAFFYFRYSMTATTLFNYVKQIIDNWDFFSKEYLIGNTDSRIRNDEVFAIAAKIIGIEEVTLPHNIPRFVHGKEILWGLSSQSPWYEQLYTEWDGIQIKIGHHPIFTPLHYHHKEWLTNDIRRRFERNYKELNRST